jgi:hypothetical protein
VANSELSELDQEYLFAFRGNIDVTLLRSTGFRRVDVGAETQRLMYQVSDRAAMVSKSLIELHTVVDDLRFALKMLSRYPWHGTDISKIKHFELTWFLFQNLCYKFREKLKLYHNCQKRLGLLLGRCSIPDDHINPRRSALFMARSILREVREGMGAC